MPFPCVVVNCGTLSNPANGMVSVSTTTYNSVATYSCNVGHTLTGDAMRTCLETGSWSHDEQTCCGELQNIWPVCQFLFPLALWGT